MLNQGAFEAKLFKQVNKTLRKHPEAFETFNEIETNIKSDIKNLNN